MKIEKNKNYEVTLYKGESEQICGILTGEDVKRLIRGYGYDKELDLWFTPMANKAYYIKEV